MTLSCCFQTTPLFKSVATDGVGLSCYQEESVLQFSGELHVVAGSAHCEPEQHRTARGQGLNSGCTGIKVVLLFSSYISDRVSLHILYNLDMFNENKNTDSKFSYLACICL